MFVGQCGIASRLKRFYSEVTPLGDIKVATGPTTSRQFYAFKLTPASNAPSSRSAAAPESDKNSSPGKLHRDRGGIRLQRVIDAGVGRPAEQHRRRQRAADHELSGA